MCREEMLNYIRENVEYLDNTTLEQMYWLLMEQVG